MALDNPAPPGVIHPTIGISFRYATESEDRYIQVGDVRTRYRTAGDSGPALVLIHGLGASLESWTRNIGALAENHRVYAPDLIWFGKTDKPHRPVSGDAFVSFITGFMDSLGLDRAFLVGNSMGGMIATKTAMRRPERVVGLVLVSSAGYGREIGWWLRLRSLFGSPRPQKVSRWAARWATGLIAFDWRTIGDEFIEMTMQMGNEPGQLEAHDRVLRYGVDWRGFKPIVLREIRDSAHLLNVPTLIVWGKQDKVVPVAHARVAARRIPNARLHIFDRCGHAPMLEKPDEFNHLVTRFVRENTSG